MKTYAEKLQELIDENNLNYSRLEKNLIDEDGYTTVTRQTISKHCSGSDPNLSTVKKLADYFNVSPMYLIDDDIENKDSIENIKVGQLLKLSDKSIKNIKCLPKSSKNILLESDFFTKTIYFTEMIKDLNKINEHASSCNEFSFTTEQKITSIEELQKLCKKFYNKFYDMQNSFDYFDSLGMWNVLESNKNDIYKTKDGLDLLYINTINTLMHSVEKSIKVIHSEMKDNFVYFIDTI